MTDTNKPAGYGHDKKGAAGGAALGQGKPGVAHTAPADKVAGQGHGEKSIKFSLDGRAVEARAGETIWQVAKREGIDIPHLCYSPEPGYRADGNCRACMVEIEGERVLAASCIRKPAEGMKVNVGNERATTARRMVFELLMADQPARETAHDPQSKFWAWAERMNVATSRFGKRALPAPDRSHPAMAVNLDACIQCNLCVRACREVQVNDVIGMAVRAEDVRDRDAVALGALLQCLGQPVAVDEDAVPARTFADEVGVGKPFGVLDAFDDHANSITLLMPSWASISSKPRFTSSRVSSCERKASTSMSPAR